MVMEMTMASDVIVKWRPTGKDDYEGLQVFNNLRPIVKHGATLYPPIIVVDSDDAIDYVHPLNYVYNLLGIRNWDGELLKPGDKITVKLKNGKERVLWEDKKTKGQKDAVFDIARNLREIGYHFDAARAAAGVTVTTEYLAQMYREQGCEEVYVYPNSITPEDHFFPNLAPHDGVRIVWEGGASHVDSWLPVKDALVETLWKHPEAKLVIFGQLFEPIRDTIDPSQLEVHPWTDYAAYKLTRACLDGDINLCLLQDQPFTRAKSAIRWYEASLGPRPEASLAANVGPYQEIEDGKTGLLFSTPREFAEKLTHLITNADLRKRLGEGAREWVMANRTVEKTVPGLVEFYRHLLTKKRQEALAI